MHFKAFVSSWMLKFENIFISNKIVKIFCLSKLLQGWIVEWKDATNISYLTFTLLYINAGNDHRHFYKLVHHFSFMYSQNDENSPCKVALRLWFIHYFSLISIFFKNCKYHQYGKYTKCLWVPFKQTIAYLELFKILTLIFSYQPPFTI